MMLPEDSEGQNEFYGPIDGVLPQDHTDTYKDLLNSYCLRAISTTEKIYREDMLPRRRLCENCYIELDSPEQFKYCNLQHSIYIHHRYNHNINLYALHCVKCKKQLLICELMAFECRDCIEEYLINHKTLLSQGELLVVKRW